MKDSVINSLEFLDTKSLKLVSLLKDLKFTISFAESCTGGLMSKKITDVSGSSSVFMGSIIAYSNEVKVETLNVNKTTLINYGAVSEEVAIEMCKGVNNNFKTDVSISTTGIAGPDGGTTAKPVGTVCFGFIINDKLYNITKHFSGIREDIRNSATLFAFEFVLKKIN